jgi:hypothetical protein
MCPTAQADRHDPPWLIDEVVLGRPRPEHDSLDRVPAYGRGEPASGRTRARPFCQTESTRDSPLTQLPEPQQHGEHTLKLANLVAAKPLQLVSVQCLAKCLLADQRPVGQFLLPVLEPRQHLAFKEAPQAL